MRFIMTTRAQVDAFERLGPHGRPFADREAWLRDIFASEIAFAHRGVDFHYVPEESSAANPDQVFIIGHVGRRVTAVENEPPEAGFAETRHEGWRATLVLIDPRSHDNGQMGGVEVLPEVGRPLAILDSLCMSVNARATPEKYFIEVNAITDPQTFWDFEKENRGDIVDVVFELHAPNMFGIRDDLDRELRQLRDNEKVRRARFEIQSEDGLNLQTPRVEATVAHALEGGGAVTARTKSNRRFNSREKARRKTVDVVLPSDPEPPPLAERLRRAILGLFGQ
jgi:hypothetical protein